MRISTARKNCPLIFSIATNEITVLHFQFVNRRFFCFVFKVIFQTNTGFPCKVIEIVRETVRRESPTINLFVHNVIRNTISLATPTKTCWLRSNAQASQAPIVAEAASAVGAEASSCRAKSLSPKTRTADATQTRCTATFTHARRLRSPTQALKCLTTNKRFKTAKKESQCGSFFFCLVSCFFAQQAFYRALMPD